MADKKLDALGQRIAQAQKQLSEEKSISASSTAKPTTTPKEKAEKKPYFERLYDEFAAYWNGEEPLWKAYWLGGYVYGLAALGLSILLGSIWTPLFHAVFVVWAVWYLVSVWQCGYNCKSMFWVIASRIASVLGILKCVQEIF